MYQRYVASVLDKYGLAYERILDPQKGYRNEIYPIVLKNEMVQLTFYKDEPMIKQRITSADAVSEFVASAGLPSRVKYTPEMVQLTNSSHRVITSLYHYLPGTTISWEAYTTKHIKLLGAAMSTMHHRLLAFPKDNQSNVIDESMSLLRRMEEYFSQMGVHTALANKLGIAMTRRNVHYTELFELCRTMPAQQLHMDFVRGNILFGKASQEHALQLEPIAMTGILDFEKTAVGPVAFDIARTLAFLLVDCKYKTQAQVRKYFLQSGYMKRGESSVMPPAKLLNTLVEFYLVHDFYKFLRHNPFESLVDNEHFVRTKDILVKRGVIHYV